MNSSNMPRPAYKVTLPGGGSDLAGSMVAAFAAGSKAFKMLGKSLISNSICEFTNSSLVDTMYQTYKYQSNDEPETHPSIEL